MTETSHNLAILYFICCRYQGLISPRPNQLCPSTFGSLPSSLPKAPPSPFFNSGLSERDKIVFIYYYILNLKYISIYVLTLEDKNRNVFLKPSNVNRQGFDHPIYYSLCLFRPFSISRTAVTFFAIPGVCPCMYVCVYGGGGHFLFLGGDGLGSVALEDDQECEPWHALYLLLY